MLEPDFRFDFKTVFRRREKLWHRTVDFRGLDTARACEEGLVEAVEKALKWRKRKGQKGGEHERPLRELLANFSGVALETPIMQALVWRLAAGKGWMEHGRLLAMSFGQLSEWFDPWTPLWIEAIWHSGVSSENRPLLAARFRVLRGPFGGLAFTQHMAHKYVVRKLARELGFTLRRRAHFGELVKCVLVGHLDLSSPRVRMDEVGEHLQARIHNGMLRRSRAKPCPRDFQWLCHECSLGYEGANSCPRATHPATWVQKSCPACNKESWFDPSGKQRVCILCGTSSARARIAAEG